MSASREKNKRKELAQSGIQDDQSQKKGMSKGGKTALTVVIAVIVVAAIVFFSLLSTGFFAKHTTAATVGGHKLTPAMVNYYANDAYTNFSSSYGTYASMFFDTNTPLSKQYVDADKQQSWYDYFVEQGLQTAAKSYAVYDEAIANGFTLTEEQESALQTQLSTLNSYATLYGYNNTDALLTPSMPHSPQAEQAVLGSMLIDADCVKDVMDKLRPEDFYLRANRDIFETIYHMFVYSRPIDGVTVAGEMEKTGVYNDNTRDYLLQLMDVTPTSANVMEYVQIVLDKSLMRQVASAAGSISAMVLDGAGDAGDMLEAAEQKVYAIRRGRSAQNMVPVSMVLEDVMAHLAELTASGGKTLPGLSTGLSAVDTKINGLNKSDLLLLAARPGMGKTSMALNVALSAARESGKTVAIFSLEMSKEQLVTRLIASEGLVENTRLVTGNLRESDWQRIAEAASSLSRMDIRIDDNPLLTVADMNAKCRRLDNLGLVVIDYLQLMSSGRRIDNRVQEVSEITRNLKVMAKELDVPIITLSQLSRSPDKRTGDHRPVLSDLRESGAIEQDADMVC